MTSAPAPLYTESNTTAAYQLNWTLHLFAKAELHPPQYWEADLKSALDRDNIHLLESHTPTTDQVAFFLSSRPHHSPADLVRLVKGRLQYLLRDTNPKLFQRNYCIQSVGEASTAKLDAYVAGQATRHSMADTRVQSRIERAQFCDEKTDLDQLVASEHGRFRHGLHIVLENEGHWNETDEERLRSVVGMIRRAATTKAWALRRVGIVSNHMHVLLAAAVTECAASIALSLMNNISYVYGMKPALRYSYYVGTFGLYDRGAIRNTLRRS